jgi:hypothetical protein
MIFFSFTYWRTLKETCLWLKERLLKILIAQQVRLLNLPASHEHFVAWKSQTLTYLDSFFPNGSKSNEYALIQKYDYFPAYPGDTRPIEESKSDAL